VFFFQAEDGIRDDLVTGVQTCALPICARAAHGLAFPGDEGAHYALNPGEAFAETYRMLNVASAVVRWALVAPSFYPDAGALRSEIGRASCRERGEVGRGGRSVTRGRVR